MQAISMAERVKKARNDAGFSQREFAEKTGVARSTIAKYEMGSLSVSIEMLRVISEVTGKPLGFFLEDRSLEWHEKFERAINDLGFVLREYRTLRALARHISKEEEVEDPRDFLSAFFGEPKGQDSTFDSTTFWNVAGKYAWNSDAFKGIMALKGTFRIEQDELPPGFKASVDAVNARKNEPTITPGQNKKAPSREPGSS